MWQQRNEHKRQLTIMSTSPAALCRDISTLSWDIFFCGCFLWDPFSSPRVAMGSPQSGWVPCVFPSPASSITLVYLAPCPGGPLQTMSCRLLGPLASGWMNLALVGNWSERRVRDQRACPLLLSCSLNFSSGYLLELHLLAAPVTKPLVLLQVLATTFPAPFPQV